MLNKWLLPSNLHLGNNEDTYTNFVSQTQSKDTKIGVLILRYQSVKESSGKCVKTTKSQAPPLGETDWVGLQSESIWSQGQCVGRFTAKTLVYGDGAPLRIVDSKANLSHVLKMCGSSFLTSMLKHTAQQAYKKNT